MLGGLVRVATLHLLLDELLLELLGLLFESVGLLFKISNVVLQVVDAVIEGVLFVFKGLNGTVTVAFGGVVATDLDENLLDVLNLCADVSAAAEGHLNGRVGLKSVDRRDCVVNIALLGAERLDLGLKRLNLLGDLLDLL